MKTNESGREEWSRHIDNSLVDSAACVRKTTDGGFIIVGGTGGRRSCSGGLDCLPGVGKLSPDLYLLKTDPLGTVLWSRVVGGEDGDMGRSVVESREGGFAVVGSTFTKNNWDMYVLRTDPEGKTLWERTFGGPREDNGRELVESETGGYFVVGKYRHLPPPGDRQVDDAYVVKLSRDGELNWERRFPGGRRLLSLDRFGDGGVVIVGVSSVTGTVNLYVVRIDELGNPIWERTYCEGIGVAVRRVERGFIVLSLSSCGFNRASLLKIDEEGELIWHGCYRGPRAGYGFIPLADGSYVVAGETRDAGGADAFLGKVRSGFFTRGDIDGDGGLTVADALGVLRALFRGGELSCLDSGDVDDSGQLDITDAVATLLYVFAGGPEPADPGFSAGCGGDPTRDLLDCEAHPKCR